MSDREDQVWFVGAALLLGVALGIGLSALAFVVTDFLSYAT